MLLPLIDAKDNPLRKSFKLVAAITAASMLAIAYPAMADDDDDDDDVDGTEQHEDTTGGEESEDTGDEHGISFFSGVTEMLPAEYYQHSAQYGPALYRRYIEQLRDKHTGQILQEQTGKMIQEYFVSYDMLKAPTPGLTDPSKPAGLKNLGITAVKLWLKRAHAGSAENPLQNACMLKPKMGKQPVHLLAEGVPAISTRSWVRRDTESDDDLTKCGLSLRLTANFSKPASREDDSASEDEVYLHGELCRYPFGRNTFNDKQDDAECQYITKIAIVPDEDILLLSELHEKKRAEASIIRAQSELRSEEKDWMNYGAVPPVTVGIVSEMFGRFITALNVVNYSDGDESHLNASYVQKVETAEYEEKVTRQDYARFMLTSFLEKLGKKTFEEFLQSGGKIDLRASGVDLSVGEFFLQRKGVDKTKPTFSMKIEKDRAITFDDKINNETIALLNRAHMEAYVNDSTELNTFRTRSEECIVDLRECEATVSLQDKDLEQVAVLMKENEDLRDRMDKKDEDFEKKLANLQKLIDQTDTASAKSARSEQKAIDDAILETERGKHQDALNKIESNHKAEVTKLTNEHDVKVEGYLQQISDKKGVIRDLESKGVSSQGQIDRLKTEVEDLKAQVVSESDRYDDMLKKATASANANIESLEEEVEELLVFKKDAEKLARKHDSASSVQMSRMKNAYEARIRLLTKLVEAWKTYGNQGPLGRIKAPTLTAPDLKFSTYSHENGTTMFQDDTEYPRPPKDEF